MEPDNIFANSEGRQSLNYCVAGLGIRVSQQLPLKVCTRQSGKKYSHRMTARLSSCHQTVEVEYFELA